MHDIKWIRDNQDALARALVRRNMSADAAAAIVADLIAKDDARRAHIKDLQEAQERRNVASREIGKAKAAKDETRAAALMEDREPRT